MEHAYEANTTESSQKVEALIHDEDMAIEMAVFIKQNILVQAAPAVLV
ncbi:hypothetical protein MHZ95_03470 [Sporosarcina sp. ACRSM]|nr:hypothetical protein [Sporosarcina sp. ACRSM]MCG7334338.1 hypothetical protein [Sporosarcina sp. ACRSM]